MRRDQGIHSARGARQKDARTGQRGAHGASQHAGQVDQGHAPPVMHQLQGDAQEYLDDQVHHQMHDAHVDEHVADEAPALVALVGIVDEQRRSRSAGALPNVVLVIGVVP